METSAEIVRPFRLVHERELYGLAEFSAKVPFEPLMGYLQKTLRRTFSIIDG